MTEEAMRWSVSLEASGDREMTQEEIIALADAIAAHSGIASGIGQAAYGAQVVVRASDEESAVAAAAAVFAQAVATAGLPAWPVSRAEAVSEASEEALEIAGQAAIDQLDLG